MKYTRHLTSTPQTRPLPGRTDMIKNNAGGYGFAASTAEQLERFMLIGSEGGTYYASENKLTVANATSIIALLAKDGKLVVDSAVNTLTEGKAPKADPALFVLALAAAYGDANTKKLSYLAIQKVCRTGTHLFTLVGMINELRGWSRGLRNGVAKFYTSRSPEQIAYQMVKYRQRNGFSHRDILRLSHPKTNNEQVKGLFAWACGKTPEQTLPVIINAFQDVQSTPNVKEIARLVTEYRLPWECVPTEQLNKPEVLEALLPSMPLTALMRNLNRFANAGLTTGISDTTLKICERLTNLELTKKAGLHPVNVCNSMLTYSTGRGFKGSKTWDVNQKIVDALHETYYNSLTVMPVSNKRVLVAVDTSGSMSTPVGGTAMTATQFSNVLALTMLKVEPYAEVIGFNTMLHNISYGRRSSLDEVLKTPSPGGGTDCSLPFEYALKNKLKLDAIVILTDSESWAGGKHTFELLTHYRAQVNKDIKVIEVASVANPYSQFPDDKDLLRVVGFDSAVLNVIGKFIGMTTKDEEVA
jgi:60 kDa SS-A/Ro ribonucleoprotein